MHKDQNRQSFRKEFLDPKIWHAMKNLYVIDKNIVKDW